MPRWPERTLEERFLAKVEKDDCWLWVGGRNPKGYGHMKVLGRMVSVHRLAYELYIGEIPDGLEIDHLCRVRHCVNPEHLDVVTHQINCARGRGARTHCAKGHVYVPGNIYRSNTGARVCRRCALDAQARYAARKKARR